MRVFNRTCFATDQHRFQFMPPGSTVFTFKYIKHRLRYEFKMIFSHACFNFGGKMLILGFFVTALAISLGAPFWFDLLRKLVNIRSAGNKPSE